MKASILLIGFLSLPFFAPTINAAPNILPGLWEAKIEMSSKSGQIEQAMAQAQAMMENMPPEQRKMMEEMMAKQGMNMNLGERTVQMCITQAQIDKFELAEADEGCEQSFVEGSKDHYKLTMNCQARGMSGEGDFIINNNKSYSGNIVMNVTMNGQQDTMTLTQNASWLSKDCGNITPK